MQILKYCVVMVAYSGGSCICGGDDIILLYLYFVSFMSKSIAAKARRMQYSLHLFPCYNYSSH